MKPILLLSLILNFILPTTAQWELIGPPGGRVWHVAVDPKFPEIVYASSDGGLFKTTDGGTTTKLVEGAGSYVLIDPINTEIIYSSIFKSTNRGDTWQRLEWPVVAINPINSENIYSIQLSILTSVLRVSYDAGRTWSIRYTFNTNTGDLSIAQSDTNIFYCFSHDSGTGIYKSTNAGRTWRKTSFQLPQGDIFMDMTINPLNPQTVFVGTKDYGVYKTIDGGNSWTYILSTAWVQEIAINPVDTSIIYVVTGDYLTGYVGNVFKTTNGGNSWTIMNNGLPSDYNRYIYAVDINQLQPEEVYIGTYGFGVYKTTDGGNDWYQTNISPAPVLDIYCDSINKGHIYAGTWDQGILKTTDMGQTWTRLDFGVQRTVQTFFRQYAINPNNTSVHYAAGGTIGLFKSTDSGLNWQLTSLHGGFDTFVWRILIHPFNSDTLFVGQVGWLNRNLFRSTNAGLTWENMWLSNYEADIQDIQIDMTNPLIVYAATAEKGIFKTTDCGTTWFNINNGLRIADSTFSVYNPVTTIAIRPDSPQTLFTGQTKVRTPDINGGLFYSTNVGESWHEVVTGLGVLEGVEKIIISKQNPSLMYVSTTLGTLKSGDGGLNWKILLPPFPSKYMELCTIDPFNDNILYIISRGGIYVYKDTLTSVHDNHNKLWQYMLHQNYPNPFNSTTIIRYAVKTSATASIKIFNILGKEVKSFQVHHTQPGEYEISWNGTDKNGVALPSGVYFSRLQIKNFIAVKKMLLLK